MEKRKPYCLRFFYIYILLLLPYSPFFFSLFSIVYGEDRNIQAHCQFFIYSLFLARRSDVSIMQARKKKKNMSLEASKMLPEYNIQYSSVVTNDVVTNYYQYYQFKVRTYFKLHSFWLNYPYNNVWYHFFKNTRLNAVE